jgi:GNAT superfamily N-acetyltransferase
MKVLIALASGFTEKHKEGFGTEISNGHGVISVLTGNKYSPTSHSITNFVVDETKRGQGYGKQLVQEVIRRYKEDIGGQVSSIASLHVFYKCGFRPYIKMDASLSETEKLFKDEWGSLLLVYKPKTPYSED